MIVTRAKNTERVRRFEGPTVFFSTLHLAVFLFVPLPPKRFALLCFAATTAAARAAKLRFAKTSECAFPIRYNLSTRWGDDSKAVCFPTPLWVSLSKLPKKDPISRVGTL